MCANLQELIKKIILSFCEVNVKYQHQLELYGSVHVRADGEDICGFLLNEQSHQTDNLGDDVVTRKISNSHGRHSDKNNPIVSQQQPKVHASQEVESQSIPDDTNSIEILSDCEESKPDLEEIAATQKKEICDLTRDFENVTDNEQRITMTHPIVDLRTNRQDCPPDQFSLPPLIVINPDVPNQKDSASEAIPTELYNTNIGAAPTSRAPTSQPRVQTATTPNVSARLNDRESENKYCAFCLKQFTSNLLLKLHLQRWHSQQLTMITKSDNNSNTCNCKLCGSVFVSYDMYCKHPCLTVPAGSVLQLKCSLCSETFKNRIHLKRHLKNIHGEKSFGYKCTVCSSVLSTKDGLQCHMNSKHSRNRVWTCSICVNKIFFSRQALYNHRKTTHSSKT